MRYAITHGLRTSGHNPVHTPEGHRQIEALKPVLQQLMPMVNRILVGTGERFQEIEDHFVINEWPYTETDLPERLFSPFLGTADGFDSPDRNIIGHRDNGAHPSCKLESYIGLTDARFFDAWAFVSAQPQNTLFLTGGEFLSALGVEKPQKGAIYRIDPDTRTVELVHQG